jgi:hypothetical protein
VFGDPSAFNRFSGFRAVLNRQNGSARDTTSTTQLKQDVNESAMNMRDFSQGTPLNF